MWLKTGYYYLSFNSSSTNNCSFLKVNDLRRLGKIAAKYDKLDTNSKLAFVVSSTISYGIARMYSIYRGLYSESKELRVFKNKPDALAWLNCIKKDLS